MDEVPQYVAGAPPTVADAAVVTGIVGPGCQGGVTAQVLMNSEEGGIYSGATGERTQV